MRKLEKRTLDGFEQLTLSEASKVLGGCNYCGGEFTTTGSWVNEDLIGGQLEMALERERALREQMKKDSEKICQEFKKGVSYEINEKGIRIEIPISDKTKLKGQTSIDGSTGSFGVVINF